MKLALPKGHLQAGVISLLAKADINFKFEGPRDYRPQCNLDWLEGRLFASHGIAELVAYNYFDCGFVGLDLIKEYNFEKVILLKRIGTRPVTLAVVGTRVDILKNPPQRALRIASEYPNLAEAWALNLGLEHIVHNTHGATESYPPDVADICFECVETGSTLAANGLFILEELFTSSTWMIASAEALQNSDTSKKIQEIVYRITKTLNKEKTND